MPTNLYELIVKTLNKTNITIAEAHMLAKKLEQLCEEWSSFTIKVDDEGFRIEVYFKVDNGDIYYEEEHIVSIFTDGTVGDFLQCKEDQFAEFEIDHDRQGTVMEYLQLLLPDFK
jgi:hypothetical protein